MVLYSRIISRLVRLEVEGERAGDDAVRQCPGPERSADEAAAPAAPATTSHRERRHKSESGCVEGASPADGRGCVSFIVLRQGWNFKASAGARMSPLHMWV